MGGGHLISVVDDDEYVREALADLLQSAGLEVATFASAEEFLGSRYLGTSACMILDLQMPGMGGLELQQRLARDGQRIPIVVLTAHGDDDARAQALAHGAVAFMRKPFDGEGLLRAVEAALKRGLTGH
jgi:FixJ family two-component response regulator